MKCTSAAATCVVAALFSFPCSAQQSDARSPDSVRNRKQSVTIRPVFRRYSVDTTTVTEQVASLDYTLTAGRTRLRLSGAPMRFTDGTTTIRGAAPAELLADVRVGRFDTVRVIVRGPSVPGSLSSGQVSALGSVGTATLDLESAALGTTSAFGIRASVAGAAGPVILGVRFGVELEPRPGAGATDSVYWRGATFRGGGTLTAFAGEFRITGGFDVSASTGDPLNGRNLFPGGGSFALRADAAGLIGTGATLASFSAFYFRPFGLDRPLQVNRLIPAGDFMGATASVLVPVGGLFLSPAVALTREASSVDLQTPLILTGLGWSLGGSLGLDIPLGRSVSVTPEAGFVGGDVSGQVLLRGVRTVPLSSFSDRVSGWWTALELSASF